jgi:hypothetical protein
VIGFVLGITGLEQLWNGRAGRALDGWRRIKTGNRKNDVNKDICRLTYILCRVTLSLSLTICFVCVMHNGTCGLFKHGSIFNEKVVFEERNCPHGTGIA